MKTHYLIIVILVFASCTKGTNQTERSISTDTIEVAAPSADCPRRVCDIPLPDRFVRTPLKDSTSFAFYLRHLPLKPQGSPVYTYAGQPSWTTEYAYAVIDSVDCGTEDLQQCADAVIRLRAEWLYAHKRYDDIAFHFTNGWLCDYKHWAEGNRVSIKGNHTSWYQAAQRDYSYPTFRKYLNMVFNYAGTLSLSKELKFVDLRDMEIGDVFIIGGSPGHAIIVIDVAETPDKHDKAFVVAESYMPAQDIHILKNSGHNDKPWFFVNDFLEMQGCNFPTYWYSTDCLKRF